MGDLADLATQIHNFGETAVRIKAQRDALAAALRDIVFGADMMLQPGIATGAFASYVREVRRVALGAIKECQL